MSGKFLQNITVRNVEEHVIRHLFSYERYSVKIQAFTRAGVGPLSPTVRIRTMEGGTYRCFYQGASLNT